MIRDLWFRDTRVMIRVSHGDGTDHISVLEHWAPMGDSPPLHLHRNEDEIFHLLEGEFRFRVGEKEQRFVAGETFIAPKGTPHTYRIESVAGGHWLTVTSGRDFEDFVRAFCRPAERD
ncbi:MAG: cupin domain-containing protein [Hyphomicrobiales bacterium]|nr:cupin domain-containing protein [Hyphomicrobiales bacterium]